MIRERHLQNTLDQHEFAGETVDRLLEDGLSDRELLAVIKLVVEEFGDEWVFDPEAVDTGDPSLLDEVFDQIVEGAGTNGDDECLAVLVAVRGGGSRRAAPVGRRLIG